MVNNKVAVILWLYNSEQYQKFIDLLLPIKPYIHLYLGLCKDTSIGIDQHFKDALTDSITVEWYPNIGADVLPFLYQLQSVKKNHHKYLIKIHSKKKLWGYRQQVHWLDVLMNDLLVKNHFLSNIRQLDSSPSQMLGCKSLILKNQEHTNTNKIKELCKLMQLPKIKYKNFIGGNIFMAKVKMFDIFLQHFDMLKNKLLEERGYVSDVTEGKYCHSLERIFGYVAGLEHNITHSFYKKKIIVNPNINNHRLHLVELYNNHCYVMENLNVYGKIIDHEPSKNITISWFNTHNSTIQQYKYLNKNTLMNYAYA